MDVPKTDAHDYRPKAPENIYKYVSADRIDVIQNAEIRFTPMLNTNDIFEVRQTFALLAGPKVRVMFEETAEQIDMDQALKETLEEMGLSSLPLDAVKALLSQSFGGDVEGFLRSNLKAVVDSTVLPMMNDAGNIDVMLERIGRTLMALSLAERVDSVPMWAHYAGNSTGFVIAFDTANEFFRRGDTRERQGLHRITYFDGKIAEPMDDPYAAFISKQADWSYEREWRLYLKVDQATRTLVSDGEQIHLVGFPRTAVRRVILGLRASWKLERELKKLLVSHYPGVQLTRICADRTTATLSEQAVEA